MVKVLISDIIQSREDGFESEENDREIEMPKPEQDSISSQKENKPVRIKWGIPNLTVNKIFIFLFLFSCLISIKTPTKSIIQC